MIETESIDCPICGPSRLEHLFEKDGWNSVKKIFDKTGFELIHLGSGGYGRSLSELLHVVFRGKRISFSSMENVLRKINFGINLGDIFAIGRKQSDSPQGMQK